MAESVLGGILNHGIDLGRMIKTDGTDLFSTYVNVTKDRLPHLADSVVDAFGQVLDIFDRPSNLRKPEFDTSALRPSRQIDLAEAHNDQSIEVNPPSTTGINTNIHVDYLAERTRAQYNATKASAPKSDDGCVTKATAEPKFVVTSASPCDTTARLCYECYLSLATIRCDSCAMHFCAICAVQRHSEGLNTTHKLVTSTSGKEANLTISDALAGDFSYGQMAAGPSGSFVGNMSKDLTIKIRPGESAYPMYDICSVHAGKPLKFACVQCHLLPVCEECAAGTHAGKDHKIVEIESAVADVKTLLGECLSAVVRRHNDLSLVLPELQQLSHASNVGLKNGTRSIRCGIQRTIDALKIKKTLGLQELVNMQQVGSAALNRLMHAGSTLNRYLKGSISQLESINGMQDAGVALNMFVDLRSNFEKLLFTDEEIPDLILEIPHWQLHSGNLPNLLASNESRLNVGMAKIVALTSYLRCQVRDSVKTIKQASGGAVASKELMETPQPHRLAERRTRGPGPALHVPGAENTLDIVSHSELKGIFLRRDSQRCSWRQRAVYLCDNRLFVLDSDLHAEDVPVESSIDLGAVTLRSFDDEDVLPVTKLQRVGHPNGFEITEHSGNAVRYWLFTSESTHTVMLWIARLGHVMKHLRDGREVAELTKAEKEKMGAVSEVETAAAASMQALHGATLELADTGFVADAAGEHKTCEDAHEPEYIHDDLNFRAVMDSLNKFKNESKSLYNKCFQPDRQLEVGRWEVQSLRNHAAALPHLDSVSVVDETPIQGCTPESRLIRGESISAGRYAMPEVVLQRSNSYVPQASVFSSESVKLPESLPKFKYSPEVKSPRSIHRIFSDLARRSRKEKGCDILDHH
ncbi:hypothetical protein X943_001419 [Babesia divergens]|uniref:Uncharacterized protein n=1 Tax=Babesia divergens TaxID=32595 RepID=A0AAD9GJC7_BABDI|nr:hypothetical protein X943_001419 [Babesia divergens]